MKTAVAFTLNGELVDALVEPRTHLADFIREERRLTGTHLGCEHGVCGACTVLIDGEPVRSCITYTVACGGRDVRTIEGFEDDAVMARLRSAFTTEHALQCGFCTPGMLIMGRDIAQRMPGADEQSIRVELSGNLCRCTGYMGIVSAVRKVCAEMALVGDVKPEPIAMTPALTNAAFTRFESASPAANSPVLAVSSVAATAPASANAANEPAAGSMTRIEDGFRIEHSPEAVWRVLSDLPQATSCLPGAELASHDERSAKGRIKIKFGPMSAAFAGAAQFERDDAARRALIRGAGTDSLSSSRARGDIAYRLTGVDNDRATRVDITLDYALVGPLAQFSRSGLVRDFAGRLIAEFGRNLAARIDAPANAAPPQAAELRGGSMLIGVLWTRLLRLLGLRR